ncbi:hypothetical protein [Streptomyces sp. NBC_00091]|uniref:hypothetical protein n=1 Tax=Streptomyces sp. NBC_00091 TaxID=2975648 RepID=UPI002259AD8B|nr:hypothetical protein [Streptomyces sp. NBC_00091]MCX5375461.1 hypothetical protein [Streptomyces sp. NBC_00091]
MFTHHRSVLVVAAGCLALSACSGGPRSVAADRSPAGTQAPGAPATARTGPAPSPSVPLPKPGAAGEVPDTARLRQLVLQPGEVPGVLAPEHGIRDVHPSELRLDNPTQPGPAPCGTMWALLGQRGAQAAVAQTFDSDEPGTPQATFLASHAGTGAATSFAQLRSAVADCPPHGYEGREATVRVEDLDAAGFPEDTIRIRITVHEEGSGAPDEVLDRIVSRVGVCVVDMVGMGPDPHPRLAEQPALRQIQRLRAAQGL